MFVRKRCVPFCSDSVVVLHFDRVASTQIIATLTVAAFLILSLTGPSQHSDEDKKRWSAHIKARAYPTVNVAQHQPRTLSERRQLCNNHTALQWILVAPLNPPNIQMIRYAKLQTWTLLIVELESTPQTWQHVFDTLWNESAAAINKELPHLVFLDRQQQLNLQFASGALGDSNSQRRNIGSLYAIMCGAKVIVEVEESIEQKEADLQPVPDIQSGPFPQALGDSVSRLINPYALYGHPEMWPRGFPLAAVSDATFEFRKVQQSTPHQGVIYKPLIRSALVDDYPTTAAALALTQLAHTGPQKFYGKPEALAIHPGYFAPLALGSTAYSSDALWGVPLLAGPNEALAPAWRSLWVQKLLWDVGGQLLVLAPSARQNRSERMVHLEALVQEEEGSYKVGPMVEFLHKWESEEKVFYLRLLELARGLRDAGSWTQSEVDSLAAWVDDLMAVGYDFPDVQAAQRQVMHSAVQPKKRKLAAFCFTGQADRAPQAMPKTLTQMQKLLTASSGQREALHRAKELEHSKADDGSIAFAHDTFAYVSTHASCNDHIRWVAQQPFSYSVLYNDPVLEVPYPLDPARFGGNTIVPMLYQMHAQQRCYEIVQEYSRLHNIEYSLIVRLRTDHRLESVAANASFALWSERSHSAVVIPQPEWDFSDIMPATGGYQDRIGWGPSGYMRVYMNRWSQFFNRTHMESDAPFHGESSLKFALTRDNIPVDRLDDDQMQYLEIPHSDLKCSYQEARHKYSQP